MGRVSLIVSADTSDAISKITSLSQAIQTAMKQFDSKIIATWEQKAETEINKVRTTLQKLSEEYASFSKLLEVKPTFGAADSLAKFKSSFEDLFKTITTFKTSFKEGYTFGATSQIETFKSKVTEAKEAIAALNTEAGKTTNVGANQAARAKKNEISKLIGAVKELNKQLAVKPVLGAQQAIADFEAGLRAFSQNVGVLMSPIFISLNAVKTQMGELTQVLNSVQQPTWVEPFKRQMLEVVNVLNQIATAYNNVRTEIRQPVGESPARREFQMTDRQAQGLYRTTTMFYRHIRREFQETRAAATETSRAIREAMTAVQGGGAGGGGAGTATAGTRLGFGEQLWSRMRSNLYSYLTMWFGVAGAIRGANALLEQHNQYLEQGKQYNQQGYNALGELYLKAGSKAKGDEYAEFSRQLAREGNFASNESAYNFASFALMSGLSKEDMRDLAPIFRAKVAKESDQRALMSAISYIKAQYGDQYSAKQISAMILEANLHGPSDIGPTANAVQDIIEYGKALNIPLPDLIALIGAGSGLNKDQRVKTALRAYLAKIHEKGLEPVIMAESMGMGAGAYYKDKNTGFYKFTDPEMQRQFEQDVAAGKEVVNLEMLMQLPAGRGRDIVREIGGGLRANTGAMIMGNFGKDPKKLIEIQNAIWAIANGDMSKMEASVQAAEEVLGSAVQITEQGIQNTGGQVASIKAAMASSYAGVKNVYEKRYPTYESPIRWIDKLFGEGYVFDVFGGSGVEGVSNYEFLSSRADWFNTAENYLKGIERDNSFTDEEKNNAREAFINMIRAMIKAYAEENGLDPNSQEGVEWATNYMRGLVTSTYSKGYFEEAAKREIRSVTPSSVPAPTATARAVKAASGAKTENQYLTEQDRLKDEADAKKKERAEAKLIEAEEKTKSKAAYDAIPKARLSAPKNVYIADQMSVALTDTSANMQEMRVAALGSKISNDKTGDNVLGRALFAYASDKTDAATDKQIVDQLVATLNQQGLSRLEIGKLAQAFGIEALGNVSSEDNKEIVKRFFEDVKNLLININSGIAEQNEPITKHPPIRTAKTGSTTAS